MTFTVLTGVLNQNQSNTVGPNPTITQITRLHQHCIRFFNGCSVQIENSVTRVTVRYHKACTEQPL